MTDLQRGIIALLSAALTEKKQPLPETFSLSEALPLIRSHQIAVLCYDGAVRCGIEKTAPAMQELFSGCAKSALRSHRQAEACKEVQAVFEAAGIDYMLLKGAALQGLYRQEGQRSMGDIDVLIREGQQDAANAEMEKLGFSRYAESDHELIWLRGGVIAELHKKLIPSYHKDYYALLRDGWAFAQPSETPHGFTMRSEDELVYLAAHFAKHYRSGGIGCRNMLDLYLLKAQKQPDESCVLARLSEIGLDVFYQNVCRTLRVWFEGAQTDEVCERITQTVFESGVYGTEQSRALGEALRVRSELHADGDFRTKYALYAAFPPLERMKLRYPILKKAPALLPAAWGVRILSALLSRKESVKELEKSMKRAPEELSAYRQALAAVGLDYRFEK